MEPLPAEHPTPPDDPTPAERPTTPAGPTPSGPRAALALRRLASALLIAASVLLALAAIGAHWVDGVLLDTPTFVSALEPALDDPAARAATADRMTSGITDAIDLRALGADLPEEFLPLVETLATEFEEFVRSQVLAAVSTDTYDELWRADLTSWHTGLATAVRADDGEAAFEGASVSVGIGPYIDLLAESTDSRLLRSLLVQVPDQVRQTEVAVFDAGPTGAYLPHLQRLDRARPYLPWLAAVAALVGIALAPHRGRAIAGVGGGALLGGVLSFGLLTLDADHVAEELVAALGTSATTAHSVVEALLAPLNTSLGYLAAVGIVIAVTGMLLARRPPTEQ